MLSAPRRLSERVQRMQVGRQADKVPPREQGGERPEQERGHQAQTAPPLSDIPCPAGVRENTSSVSWGGEWLQKIVSYKASKNLRENLGESSLLSNIWHRQWGWRVCLWPRLSYCCGPAWPTPGQLPGPSLQRPQEGRAGGRSLSVGFEVSLVPCLEARVFGNGRGREDKQSVGRWEGPVAPSSPRVQPWGHHGQVTVLGLSDEQL